MASDPKYATQEQHESLKESVESLADSVAQQGQQFAEEIRYSRELQRKDAEDFRHSIEALGSSMREALADRDRQDKENRKFPTGLLTLVFSVMVTLGTIAAWNMNRIEAESRNRHLDQDIILQREMRILDGTIQTQQRTSRELFTRLDDQVQSFQREQIEKVSKLEERTQWLRGDFTQSN